MTNEEKKAWLGRYPLAEVAVQRIQEEIARWDARAAAVTVRYGGAAGGGGEDPLQRGVEEILALRGELVEELRRQVALRREIEDAVRQVEDERLRELLRLRYLGGWQLERIAAVWRYDYRWIKRLHSRALEKLAPQSPLRPVV